MGGDTVTITLQPRKEFTVGMREAGKRPGVDYVRSYDSELFGPYRTGCADDRACYDVWMQQGKAEQHVLARMNPIIPPVLCHYDAEYMRDEYSYVDGDIVTDIPDIGPLGLDLVHGALDDGNQATFLDNRLNGRPVISYGGENTSPYGFASPAFTPEVQTHDMTVYLVCRYPLVSGTLGFGLRQEDAGYASGLWPDSSWEIFYTSLGCINFSGAPVHGMRVRHAYANGVGYQAPWFYEQPVSMPNGWTVWAYRFSKSMARAAVFANGVDQAMPFIGNDFPDDVSTDPASGTWRHVQIGWSVDGYTTGIVFEFAEIKCYLEAHDDSTIAAKTTELREKFGL